MRSWLKWYAGSITDIKFPKIATSCGVPLAFVIAVWAYLLERAHENSGSVDALACTALDQHLGMAEGTTECILNQMIEAGLVTSDMRIKNWEKLQGTRKSGNGTSSSSSSKPSTDRVRAYRERKKKATHETDETRETQCNAAETVETFHETGETHETLHETHETDETRETQCNAAKNRREEKRREEEKDNTPLTPQGGCDDETQCNATETHETGEKQCNAAETQAKNEETLISAKSSPIPKKKARKKRAERDTKQYGSEGNVLLTDEEYGRLCEEYGKARTDEAIEYFGNAMIERPKYDTQDHNRALRRWVFSAVQEQHQRSQMTLTDACGRQPFAPSERQLRDQSMARQADALIELQNRGFNFDDYDGIIGETELTRVQR